MILWCLACLPVEVSQLYSLIKKNPDMQVTFNAIIFPHLTQPLLSVQNAAARLIFGLRHSEHNGRVRQSSVASCSRAHPLQSRRTQAVNDSAPVYLSSYFTRVADVPSRLRLWSSTSDQLIVQSYNRSTVGKWVFPESNKWIQNY